MGCVMEIQWDICAFKRKNLMNTPTWGRVCIFGERQTFRQANNQISIFVFGETTGINHKNESAAIIWSSWPNEGCNAIRAQAVTLRAISNESKYQEWQSVFVSNLKQINPLRPHTERQATPHLLSVSGSAFLMQKKLENSVWLICRSGLRVE